MHLLDDERSILSRTQTLEELEQALQDVLKQHLACDEVRLHCNLNEAESYAAEYRGPSLFVSDIRRTPLPERLKTVFQNRSAHSFALVPLYNLGTTHGLLEVCFTSRYLRWQKDQELYLETIAEWASLQLLRISGQLPAERMAPRSQNLDEELKRVILFGNLVVLRIDPRLGLLSLSGDTEPVTGLASEEIMRHPEVWQELLSSRDIKRLAIRARKNLGRELSEELKVKNVKTLKTHQVLLRAVPQLNADGNLLGWEGYAVDVSERREAQEKLITQGRRIEALYEVAASLKLNVDPALVALRGLRALVRATNSDCGLIGLVDSATGALEVVASEGLSESYIQGLNERINTKSLARISVDTREGFFIEDLLTDSRAAVDIAKKEGLRATIIVPLQFEEKVLGTIVLFCRRPHAYTQDDFDLVLAASSQIGLAARQAELYLAEKRQANSLAALYRLSHELSKQLSLKQVAEHAFPIIQEEFSSKRLWLGVLNERGTHIAGVAGSGPGIRQHVIDLQIELNLRHDFLDEALTLKRPVIVESGKQMECSGLARILRRLAVGTFVIVPLVSLGRVMGILIVEPTLPSPLFAQRKLPLLTSMANEIATVVMARRFESRMADADKMRMAGLLASGIAHNFNNLLQAVMGQASLIEMQSGSDSKVSQSAKMIVESAGKGAQLVKQLFSFSMQGNRSPNPINLNQLLLDSQDLYRSALGSHVVLELSLANDAPEVVADFAQVQQVLTNLLMNSKDAIGSKPEGKVKILSRRIRLRSGEVDPELAPGVYLRIDVEDNGIGMDREQQTRCFEPFYTTKNVDARTGIGFQGTGLGLSTAYSIMKQHDGLIVVRSQQGIGTAFSLFFPAVTVKVSDYSGDQVSREPMKSLTICGFDETGVASFRTALEGVEIITLSGLEKLQASVRKDEIQFDWLALDLDTLGMRVMTVFEDLRRRGRHLVVLAVCADGAKWVPLMRGYSFAHVVEKPLNPWMIQTALQEMGLQFGTSKLRLEKTTENADKGKSSSPSDSPSEEQRSLEKD